MKDIHNVLFTATKKGERPYQDWVSPADAERKRKAWERDGWTVTLRPMRDSDPMP